MAQELVEVYGINGEITDSYYIEVPDENIYVNNPSKRNYYLTRDGMVQFNADLNWYSNGYDTEYVSGYLNSQITSYGNPKSDSRYNNKVIPFDCRLVDAFIKIRSFTGTGSMSIKFQNFETSEGLYTPLNEVTILDLTSDTSSILVNTNLVNNVDYTINKDIILKKNSKISMLNKSNNSKSIITNWDFLLVFEEI